MSDEKCHEIRRIENLETSVFGNGRPALRQCTDMNEMRITKLEQVDKERRAHTWALIMLMLGQAGTMIIMLLG